MRFLEINSFFTVGGPPRIVNGIYDTLIEEGHECKIAAAREKVYVQQHSIRIGSNLDIKINALKARILDNEGFSAKGATKKLIKEIEAYNPDVVHLHNLHGYYINLEILFNYLKKRGGAVVWTLHDCWAFTGHCAYFDYAQCEQWRTGCKRCRHKRSYPSSYLFNRAKYNFQRKKAIFSMLDNMTIVTPSRWLKDLVKESFLGKYCVKVIPNGVDLKVFKPKDIARGAVEEKREKKIILGVAQVWDQRKGLKYFLELNEIMPKTWKIVLVGLSGQQLKSLPTSMTGLGKTKSVEELVELYNMADVFVNPTLEDNYPTTNIEAVACGTPVVTFSTGGSPETLLEGMGYVAKEKTAEALLEKIQEVFLNEALESHFSEKGYLFDKRCCYQKYIDLFKELTHG